MLPDLLGPLRVHAAGGSDRRGGGDGPAILLCHGFGAPGDDLVDLGRVIDAGAGVRWFFPEAPLTLPGAGAPGGRSTSSGSRPWRGAAIRGRSRTRRPRASPRPARRSRRPSPRLEAERGVTRERLLIGGFSQGAMLTTEIALTPIARSRGWPASREPPLGRALGRGRAADGAKDPRLPRPRPPGSGAALRRGRGPARAPREGGRLGDVGGARRPARDPPAVVTGLGAFARRRLSA